MYRAIVEIGEYKVGEEVPTEKAEYWLKVYKIPQVEKVDEEIEESEPEEETKVETKQIEDSSKIKVLEFEKELAKIKGIGFKTAWDITKVFPTEDKLREAISHDDELPFRDDIEKKLREKYG